MPVQLTEKQERRRKNYLAEKRDRTRRARIAGRKPLRDPEYLAWIRTLECSIPSCLMHWRGHGIEAAHVGDRGLRQKCSDYEAIPLCAWHHRLSPLSHHRAGKRFWKYHGLDRDKIIAELNARYERERQ